jgi:multidrug efflux pump subunit AcrB
LWLVKIALNRPYTFIVLGLLVLLEGVAAMRRTPADIFSQINIPVVSVAWTYTGLNPVDLEARVTPPFEKVLTTLVDNIERLESTTYNGVAVVKIFLQPGVSLDTANDFMVARDNMAGGSRVTTGRQVPFCMFTDPELARIGLSETEAKQRGIPYRVA